MIVQLTGNVNYAITLDPTVWIFDDRKVLLDELFTDHRNVDNKNTHSKTIHTTAERLNRDIYQPHTRPPVNKSISKFEKEKILKNSYVMPIADFLSHAEIRGQATDATLKTSNGDINITLAELQNCYLLFAIKGKPVQKDGPVHLFFKDGSNKDQPITGISQIIIN